MTPAGVILGGGGWIRTTEARASDLQSDPFGHSGTPPEGRTFSRSRPPVSTGPEGEFCPSVGGASGPPSTVLVAGAGAGCNGLTQGAITARLTLPFSAIALSVVARLPSLATTGHGNER